jgi:NAD(P)-dependent dehydrogenase (short-subunit alcohol dehydrogenase family)
MTNVMTPAHVRERLARQIERATRSQVADVESRYTFVRPLLGAANDLVDWMRNQDNRLMFGLPDIDAALRGIARGELCYLTGRAHSGKTQVVLNMVRHNPKGRFLYFTPDEVDNLVLTKLIALVHGVSADRLEARMRAGDASARNLAYTTSIEHFPNLVIIDQALTFDQMTLALREAEDWWQAPCDGVIIDYLDLLPGVFDTDRIQATLKGQAAKTGKSIEELKEARKGGVPARRYGTLEEFGEVCAFICSAQAGYLTGQNILLDGGAYPGTY